MKLNHFNNLAKCLVDTDTKRVKIYESEKIKIILCSYKFIVDPTNCERFVRLRAMFHSPTRTKNRAAVNEVKKVLLSRQHTIFGP